MTRLRVALLVGLLAANALFFGVLSQREHVREESRAEDDRGESAGKTTPSDWFYAQRVNADGSFPDEAWTAALEQVQMQRGAGILPTSSGSSWMEVGPFNIGGRVTALAVDPNGTTIYLGAANGGVWRSTNNGVNWSPLTDHLPITSIGALTIDPNDPSVLWCGTGEANSSVDSYDGNGVWRSMDAGVHWMHMGLPKVGRIGAVAIDPQNSYHVLVAAMGRQFSTGPDRGLYRTLNRGATWTKVLSVSDSTGVGDIVVNPVHPDTMFCATWERVRRTTYRRAYGPESGIWRSVDRGATWTRLGNGLPTPSDSVGRISLAIAPSQPSTIYAQIGSGASQGYVGLGFYRSTDGGVTWTRRDVGSTFRNAFGGFVWYFGEMAVDPVNADRVYALGMRLIRSDDGGGTWTVLGEPALHPDQHAIWIDPANTDHLYVGNDGGFFEATDGSTFFPSIDLPISQFYAGDVDQTNAARIYGGTQDNNTLKTDSGAYGWYPILGGDGFYVISDPVAPNVVLCEWQNCSSNSGVQRSTAYGDAPDATLGWVASDRFGWSTPFTMSPSNHNVLLAGSQYVYKSTNNGLNWAKASPDLSNGTASPLVFCTITTLDISKPSSNVYYAGTDDGRVWRSTTAGGTGGSAWTNISAGLPGRWVTRVTADPLNAQVVYVTLSGFTSDNQAAMIYRSTNQGTTWTNISGNLPNVPANDLLVDPADTQRLYLATDLGVWTTRNLGATWYELGGDMPLVSVADLTLHTATRQLFAFTHGRSAWKLDLNTLPVSAPPSAAPVALSLGAPHPNPARAGVRFTLESARDAAAEVSIYDVIGRRISTLHEGALGAGRHEFAWTRRDDRGVRASAGVYFVRAIVGGATRTQRFVVTD